MSFSLFHLSHAWLTQDDSFERAQYHDMHKLWMQGDDGKHKSAIDTYGAEHLARLLGTSLPHPSPFSQPA
jgi:hypothetical protein